jgi:hypothetical protein
MASSDQHLRSSAPVKEPHQFSAQFYPRDLLPLIPHVVGVSDETVIHGYESSPTLSNEQCISLTTHWSELGWTRNHAWLFHLRPPQRGGSGSLQEQSYPFTTPGLSPLPVALYDSQGYDGCTLTRLHTGKKVMNNNRLGIPDLASSRPYFFSWSVLIMYDWKFEIWNL